MLFTQIWSKQDTNPLKHLYSWTNTSKRTVTDMRPPYKPYVIRDMKRGAVVVEYKDLDKKQVSHKFTLNNPIIPDDHMIEFNLDNPVDLTTLYCYNIDEGKWVHLDLTNLEAYHPQGRIGAQEIERRKINSISEEKNADARGAGDRDQSRETSQEAQTDVGGTESSSDRETS